MKLLLLYVGLAVMSYVQSIMFTVQSRARNQNDLAFFQKANILAQASYYGFQVLLAGSIWNALTHGSWIQIVITGVVFVFSSNHAAMKTISKMIESGR